MRMPTAKVIEDYVLDWTYGSTRARTVGTPPPTPIELMIAQAIDSDLRIGKTRAQLVLPDQRDLLDDFRRQLGILAKGLHPWQRGPFNAHLGGSLLRLVRDVEAFQRRSIVDRMVDVLG